MKFKNIYSHSCKLSFNGLRIEINGELETEDKELIAFLEEAPDFIKVGGVAVDTPKEIEEEIKEVEEENPLEELKKYADELGLKYHPNIGIEKLQAKIDEHLDK